MNVGDVKTFTLPGTLTSDMRYVWKWWDGQTDCTTVNSINKSLNMGGNPSDGFLLRYTVTPVDPLGQSAEYAGNFVANNPPQIVVGSARLSQNGQQVNFDTTASVDVYDLEGQQLSYAWTSDGVFLGHGTATPIGLIPGTYSGTYCGLFWGTRVSLDYTVEHIVTLGLNVTDALGGETEIEFPLYGYRLADAAYAPVASPLTQTDESSSLPIVTIGEPAVFSVYAATPVATTRFSWVFSGTNGWASPTSSEGVANTLPDGSVQSTVVKSTTSEVPGHKIAEVDVIDITHDTRAHIEIPIELVLNESPIIDSTEFLPAAPVAGNWVKFSVNYVDPNADIATVIWNFTSPSVVLYGRTVWVDTLGMSSGNVVVGTCTVYDRFNATDSEAISVTLA